MIKKRTEIEEVTAESTKWLRPATSGVPMPKVKPPKDEGEAKPQSSPSAESDEKES